MRCRDLGRAGPVPGVPLHALPLGGGGRGDGLLTLGVLLGSAGSQVAQSAGLTSILLEVPSPAAAAEEPVVAAAPEASAAPEPAPLVPATTSSLPATLPVAEEPLPEAAPEPTQPPEFFEEEETLPPVKHVFLIVLGENSYEEAFGTTSPAPYLAQTLAAKGELLANYYAVTKGDLANQIALLSGQGPTVETAAGCPTYADIVPGTISAEGQVEGVGCVYPTATADAAGPADRKETDLEGLCRGSRRSLRARGRLARPIRLLPLADRPARMRAQRRQPRTAGAGPENGDEDAGPLLHRSQRLPRRCRTALRTGAAGRRARRRRVPEADRAGDRSLARLQRRRADRDHLRPGAADRADPRRQLLLHLPGLPEPAPPKPRQKPRPGRSNQRAAAAASACCCSRPSSPPAWSTKAATSTTSRCCSASRNCSNWNRSATPPKKP